MDGEKTKTLKVKEITHSDLIRLKAKLTLRDGEEKDFDQTIKELIKLYEATELAEYFPDFTHVNVFNDHATILDKNVGREVNVYFKEDGKPFCERDKKSDCEHVRYTLRLPEVQAAYKRKGLKLPPIQR